MHARSKRNLVEEQVKGFRGAAALALQEPAVGSQSHRQRPSVNERDELLGGALVLDVRIPEPLLQQSLLIRGLV